MLGDFGGRAQGRLVGAHDFCDREAALAAARKQVGGGAERIGKGDAGARLLLRLVLANDEAAADRAPGFLEEHRAGGVTRREAQRVGMALGDRHEIEADVGLWVEGDLAEARESDDLPRLRPRDDRVDIVGIDGRRRFAGKAEDHRLVDGVALAGEGERAIERDRHPGDARQKAALAETRGEGGGGLHRPDRMRRGRADADLEQFEDADHGSAP